jgi:DNA-dependent RNA polymerase auxiliary subunit epsilon
MGWFAQIFQHPNHKPGVALVLRGLKGTGKSIVADIIGSLLGWHHVLVNSAEKITGKFNGHQARCLLLQADEAVWAGDHQAESVLKGLITNTKHLVEHKGKDPIEMPNFMRVFMSANADWVVPASFDERRYAVLDVGDARRGDHAYFGAIMKQMDSGGREALLHHLLHFDLSDLNIGVAPQTDALAEQKLRSMSPEVAFWHQCLIDGEIFAGTGWPVLIERKALYNRYLDHVAKRNIRRPLTENEFGIELRRLVNNKKLKTEIGSSQPRSAGRRWHHELPTLELCRDAFDDLAGFVTGWGSIDTDLSVPSNALT